MVLFLSDRPPPFQLWSALLSSSSKRAASFHRPYFCTEDVTVLPERYFSLGKLGALTNATAVAWLVFLDILYCFPTTMPITPQNMSYVSVVSVGLIGFVLALVFTTMRGVFQGPQIDPDLLDQRRYAAIERNDKVFYLTVNLWMGL